MERSILKLIDELAASSGCTSRTCWNPAADLYRTSRGWLVKFDLAGVTPGEIQVSLEGNRLTISGSRRDALVQQGFYSYSMEISYNRFQRSVELPTEMEASQVETEYRDGMLLVWLNQRGDDE